MNTEEKHEHVCSMCDTRPDKSVGIILAPNGAICETCVDRARRILELKDELESGATIYSPNGTDFVVERDE